MFLFGHGGLQRICAGSGYDATSPDSSPTANLFQTIALRHGSPFSCAALGIKFGASDALGRIDMLWLAGWRNGLSWIYRGTICCGNVVVGH